jgi:hypothetical protein
MESSMEAVTDLLMVCSLHLDRIFASNALIPRYGPRLFRVEFHTKDGRTSLQIR